MARPKRRPGRKGGRMDFIQIVGDTIKKPLPERTPVTPKPRRLVMAPRPERVGRPRGRQIYGRKGFLGIKGVEFVEPFPRKESVLKPFEFMEFTRGFKELSVFGKRTGEFIAKDVLVSAVEPTKPTEAERKLAKGYQRFMGEWLSDIFGLNRRKKRRK